MYLEYVAISLSLIALFISLLNYKNEHKKRTFEAISALLYSPYYKVRKQFTPALEAAFNSNKPNVFSNALEKDFKTYTAVTDMLNHHELMALLLKYGYIRKSIFVRLMKSSYVKNYKIFKFYIDYCQIESPRTWIEFTEIATKKESFWKQNFISRLWN